MFKCRLSTLLLQGLLVLIVGVFLLSNCLGKPTDGGEMERVRPQLVLPTFDAHRMGILSVAGVVTLLCAVWLRWTRSMNEFKTASGIILAVVLVGCASELRVNMFAVSFCLVNLAASWAVTSLVCAWTVVPSETHRVLLDTLAAKFGSKVTTAAKIAAFEELFQTKDFRDMSTDEKTSAIEMAVSELSFENQWDTLEFLYRTASPDYRLDTHNDMIGRKVSPKLWPFVTKVYAGSVAEMKKELEAVVYKNTYDDEDSYRLVDFIRTKKSGVLTDFCNGTLPTNKAFEQAVEDLHTGWTPAWQGFVREYCNEKDRAPVLDKLTSLASLPADAAMVAVRWIRSLMEKPDPATAELAWSRWADLMESPKITCQPDLQEAAANAYQDDIAQILIKVNQDTDLKQSAALLSQFTQLISHVADVAECGDTLCELMQSNTVLANIVEGDQFIVSDPNTKSSLEEALNAVRSFLEKNSKSKSAPLLVFDLSEALFFVTKKFDNVDECVAFSKTFTEGYLTLADLHIAVTVLSELERFRVGTPDAAHPEIERLAGLVHSVLVKSENEVKEALLIERIIDAIKLIPGTLTYAVAEIDVESADAGKLLFSLEAEAFQEKLASVQSKHVAVPDFAQIGDFGERLKNIAKTVYTYMRKEKEGMLEADLKERVKELEEEVKSIALWDFNHSAALAMYEPIMDENIGCVMHTTDEEVKELKVMQELVQTFMAILKKAKAAVDKAIIDEMNRWLDTYRDSNDDSSKLKAIFEFGSLLAREINWCSRADVNPETLGLGNIQFGTYNAQIEQMKESLEKLSTNHEAMKAVIPDIAHIDQIQNYCNTTQGAILEFFSALKKMIKFNAANSATGRSERPRADMAPDEDATKLKEVWAKIEAQFHSDPRMNCYVKLKTIADALVESKLEIPCQQDDESASKIFGLLKATLEEVDNEFTSHPEKVESIWQNVKDSFERLKGLTEVKSLGVKIKAAYDLAQPPKIPSMQGHKKIPSAAKEPLADQTVSPVASETPETPIANPSSEAMLQEALNVYPDDKTFNAVGDYLDTLSGMLEKIHELDPDLESLCSSNNASLKKLAEIAKNKIYYLTESIAVYLRSPVLSFLVLHTIESHDAFSAKFSKTEKYMKSLKDMLQKKVTEMANKYSTELSTMAITKPNYAKPSTFLKILDELVTVIRDITNKEIGTLNWISKNAKHYPDYAYTTTEYILKLAKFVNNCTDATLKDISYGDFVKLLQQHDAFGLTRRCIDGSDTRLLIDYKDFQKVVEKALSQKLKPDLEACQQEVKNEMKIAPSDLRQVLANFERIDDVFFKSSGIFTLLRSDAKVRPEAINNWILSKVGNILEDKTHTLYPAMAQINLYVQSQVTYVKSIALGDANKKGYAQDIIPYLDKYKNFPGVADLKTKFL